MRRRTTSPACYANGSGGRGAALAAAQQAALLAPDEARYMERLEMLRRKGGAAGDPPKQPVRGRRRAVRAS